MNIAFDAKRAYHNGTGLGHYSRTLIRSLSEFYPEHQYYLYNPKSSSRFEITGNNIHERLPRGLLNKVFPAAWRSNWVKKDLQENQIDLYHGLSHEIPLGIQKTGIKSIVTIHDLIHERYPEQYNRVDVEIYNKKFRNACANADKVIAASNQTKQDIIDFYKTPEEKIVVCYQSCNPSFGKGLTEEEKRTVRLQYDLPEKYFLYVGSLIERKNLLNICKAFLLLKDEMNIPLIVIGDGKQYKQIIKKFISQNNLERKIILLSEQPKAQTSKTFQTAEDFPEIYQSATALVYPSYFEGFGIPVLEALWSRLPVITSNTSCLPEVGGNAACYVDPGNAQEIAEAMKKIYLDKNYAASMIEKGWQQAQNFTRQKCAEKVMTVYKSV